MKTTTRERARALILAPTLGLAKAWRRLFPSPYLFAMVAVVYTLPVQGLIPAMSTTSMNTP